MDDNEYEEPDDLREQVATLTSEFGSMTKVLDTNSNGIEELKRMLTVFIGNNSTQDSVQNNSSIGTAEGVSGGGEGIAYVARKNRTPATPVGGGEPKTPLRGAIGGLQLDREEDLHTKLTEAGQLPFQLADLSRDELEGQTRAVRNNRLVLEEETKVKQTIALKKRFCDLLRINDAIYRGQFRLGEGEKMDHNFVRLKMDYDSVLQKISADSYRDRYLTDCTTLFLVEHLRAYVSRSKDMANVTKNDLYSFLGVLDTNSRRQVTYTKLVVTRSKARADSWKRNVWAGNTSLLDPDNLYDPESNIEIRKLEKRSLKEANTSADEKGSGEGENG
jgi:hypothetical protein